MIRNQKQVPRRSRTLRKTTPQQLLSPNMPPCLALSAPPLLPQKTPKSTTTYTTRSSGRSSQDSLLRTHARRSCLRMRSCSSRRTPVSCKRRASSRRRGGLDKTRLRRPQDSRPRKVDRSGSWTVGPTACGTLATEGGLCASATRVLLLNGHRHIALVGKTGHVATFDWQAGTLHAELQLRETCRDITLVPPFASRWIICDPCSRFLQDHSHFAVAQKKYVFIYDRDGVELHKLKSHIEPTRLEFLPYHWLLVSVVRLSSSSSDTPSAHP